MGDQADYLTEQGMDQLALHEIGECDPWCEYCEEEAQIFEDQDAARESFEQDTQKLVRKRRL